MKMNIKKGDTVKVITGKDKGKSGKVLEVFPKEGRIAAEGLNIHVRFSRPKKQGEKGQRLETPGAMNISKLMVVCTSCGNPTRIAHTVNELGSLRTCVHCGKNF
jgi:large subunit ribosomal protein L24